MTTLLKPDQVDLARSIRNSAAVFLTMLMIERVRPGKAITVWEVAPILELDIRTVEKHMKSLCVSNRAVFDGRGYVLTGGHALFLGIDQAQLDMASAEAEGRQALGIKQDHAALALSPESYAKDFTHTMFAPLKKIEEDCFDSKDSSSSESEFKSAQNARLLPGREVSFALANRLTTVPVIMGVTDEDGVSIYRMECMDGSFVTSRDILNATEVIEGFGDIPLHVLPVDAIKPELALAWVAKAYDDRQRLLHPPAGLVVSRLRNVPADNPHRKYFKNPTQYLPDEYCGALRLGKYECKSCVDVMFSTGAAYEAHVREVHTVQQEVQEAECFEWEERLPMPRVWEANEELSPMWNTVLETLQMEMPRASYETWLRDTVALSLDDGSLMVGARNKYCADWLESRLSKRINELAGMPVEFVVASVV